MSEAMETAGRDALDESAYQLWRATHPGEKWFDLEIDAQGAWLNRAGEFLAEYAAAQAVSLPDREVRGWLVVDKKTRALDWDGELHPTEEAARASLDGDRRFNDPDWEPFENYDILPVLAALSTQPAAGEVEWEYAVRDRKGIIYFSARAGEIEGDVAIRRHRAGPWIEVHPEPAPELAELFPGTLAALDHLSIRPEADRG